MDDRSFSTSVVFSFWWTNFNVFERPYYCDMSCWTLRDRFVVLYRTQFLFFAGKILPVFEMSPYDIDLSKWQVSCLCKKGKCRNFHHCKLANSKRCTTIHICILLQTFRSCFYISQTKNKTFQALVDWTTYSL